MQFFIKSLRIYQIRSLVTYLNCMGLDLLYYKKYKLEQAYSRFVITLKLMSTIIDSLHFIKNKTLIITDNAFQKYTNYCS